MEAALHEFPPENAEITTRDFLPLSASSSSPLHNRCAKNTVPSTNFLPSRLCHEAAHLAGKVGSMSRLTQFN